VKTQHHNSKFRQQGVAIVEATIALPLFLLLALACGEIGRMLMQYNTLNKAQQDGARYLSYKAVDDSTNVIVLDFNGPNGNAYEAANLVVYGNRAGTGTPLLYGLTASDVTIDNPILEHVRITTTYNYTPVFGPVFSVFGFGTDISLTFPLQSSITMRVIN